MLCCSVWDRAELGLSLQRQLPTMARQGTAPSQHPLPARGPLAWGAQPVPARTRSDPGHPQASHGTRERSCNTEQAREK